MDRKYKFLIAQMIAFTIHMPMPVCDGDNLRTGGIQDSDQGQRVLKHCFYGVYSESLDKNAES